MTVLKPKHTLTNEQRPTGCIISFGALQSPLDQRDTQKSERVNTLISLDYALLQGVTIDRGPLKFPIDQRVTHKLVSL
jgi:hypothetical protein